jgi:hypothetical protein
MKAPNPSESDVGVILEQLSSACDTLRVPLRRTKDNTGCFKIGPLGDGGLVNLRTLHESLVTIHVTAKTNAAGHLYECDTPHTYILGGKEITVDEVLPKHTLYIVLANYGIRGDQKLDFNHLVWLLGMRAAGSIGGEADAERVYLLANGMPYFRTAIAASRTPEDPVAQAAAMKTACAVSAFAKVDSLRGNCVVVNVQGGHMTRLVNAAMRRLEGLDEINMDVPL